MLSVQSIQVLAVDVSSHNLVPEWYHEKDDNRKEHFHHVNRRKTKETHHQQLEELQDCELMYLPLRASSYVMIRRIFVLLTWEQ